MRRRDAPDPRRALADTLVQEETETLEQRFGTAGAMLDGRGRHNATHSRYDVLGAARELARHLVASKLLDPAALPLVDLAAIFHAHDGACGDGADQAVAAMRSEVFDDEDRSTVTAAINGVSGGHARCRIAAPQRTALWLETGLANARLATMSTVDVVCAIVADADRADLGTQRGLHRILLALVEDQRTRLDVPDGSDGRDVVPEPASVCDWLFDAAGALDDHRWVLAASRSMFPLGAANSARLRAEQQRYEAGEVTWRALVAQAAREARAS